MSAILQNIINDTRNAFEEILQFVTEKCADREIHEVEEGLLPKLLDLGRSLLTAFLRQKGTGSVGQIHKDVSGIERGLHSIKERQYISIFGEIKVARAYYWCRESGGIFPLDARLNLPENGQSYVLEKWQSLLAAHGSYKQVREVLTKILGLQLLSNDVVENTIAGVSAQVEEFYNRNLPVQRNTEAELLVFSADGKGIPMKKAQPAKKRLRLKKGEKPGKKKMSTVTSVYSVEKHVRTVEDIVKDVARVQEEKVPGEKEGFSVRPKPQNKIVRATLKGKEKAFADLSAEVKRRDPEGIKEKVALIDGEKKLRELVKTHFVGSCIILDIYHVLEYLWKACHVFHSEGSEEAERWTKAMLQALLQGKVEIIILYLKYYLQEEVLTAARQKTLEKVVGYLENGKDCMKYDEYIAKGYPIGSGVVEGACRNLVKDRMELSGMHWTEEGAERVLGMRSIELNGLFEDYYRFRVKSERTRLYENHGYHGQESLAA